MATIHKSIDIDAPAERVFAILTDIKRLPDYARGLVLPLEMVDKSTSHLQNHFGPVFAMRQSRPAFSSQSEAPSKLFCCYLTHFPTTGYSSHLA